MLPFFSFHHQIDAAYRRTCSPHVDPPVVITCRPLHRGRQSCCSGNPGGTVENRDVNTRVHVCVCLRSCLYESTWGDYLVTDGGKEWTRVSKAVFRLVVESSCDTHAQMHREILYAVSLSVYFNKTGQEKTLYFSMKTQSHHRQNKMQMHSHTHTQTHKTLLWGPGLHFTVVCPTSSRSASLHFQQRDGK